METYSNRIYHMETSKDGLTVSQTLEKGELSRKLKRFNNDIMLEKAKLE